MPDATPLAKAALRQLDADFKDEINPDKWVELQFNPETLKVSFSNQIVQPASGGDKAEPQGRQFVGAGTTKLSLQIWFDVNAPQSGDTVDDVRELTQKVAYYITPAAVNGQFLPPAVRFLWGSFQFDGLMDSLDESLEFFSPEGRPLRASMSMGLSQQKITVFPFRPIDSPPGTGGPGGAAPGTRPLIEAQAGVTLQGLANIQGRGGDWQSIAAANGIANPRLLATGQRIDMNASVGIKGSITIG